MFESVQYLGYKLDMEILDEYAKKHALDQLTDPDMPPEMRDPTTTFRGRAIDGILDACDLLQPKNGVYTVARQWVRSSESDPESLMFIFAIGDNLSGPKADYKVTIPEGKLKKLCTFLGCEPGKPEWYVSIDQYRPLKYITYG